MVVSGVGKGSCTACACGTHVSQKDPGTSGPGPPAQQCMLECKPAALTRLFRWRVAPPLVAAWVEGELTEAAAAAD